MPAKRRQRIIDKLRQRYPGEWRWSHSKYCWCGPEFDVWAVGRLSSVKPGRATDALVRSDTGETVEFGDEP